MTGTPRLDRPAWARAYRRTRQHGNEGVAAAGRIPESPDESSFRRRPESILSSDAKECSVEADVLLPTDEIRTWVRDLWLAAGSAPEEAQLVADHLIGANLAGHDSH